MNLENKFEDEMIGIYTRAKNEIKYNPTRFLQLISEKGGLQAAKILIHKPDESAGLTRLYEEGRLDLSMEVLVLKDEYKRLFTEEEINICKEKLRMYNYKF